MKKLLENIQNFTKQNITETALFGILIALCIVFAILLPGQFLSAANFESMAFQMPEFGLICLGMMTIILTSGIHLSIVTSSTFSCIVGAFVLNSSFFASNPMLAIVLGVATMIGMALVTGLLNGLISAVIGVPAFLATLGTMTAFSGISLVLTKGGSVIGFPEGYYVFGSGKLGGIPIPLLIFIVMAIVTYFVLERSHWGLNIHMIGINPVASKFSGVNTKRVLLLAFVYAGLLAGIAAVIMGSRYNSARMDYGANYMMNSILVVILGGTAIQGGRGKVIGTVLSVLVLQVISSGFSLLNVDRNVFNIIVGILLILVLFGNYLITTFSKTRAINRVTGRFSGVENR